MAQENAEKNRLIALASEQAYNAVLITDADFDGGGPFIVHCNPAFCQMTGYTREALIGRPPKILQGPDTDMEVIASLKQALTQRTFWEGSTINYRNDGQAYVVNWNVSPVFNENNELTNFVSVQQDITSHVKAEKERETLIKALNQANDPVVITDEKEHIVFVNAAFEKLTGYHKEEVLGQTPAILNSGEQDAAFYRNLWQSLEKNQPFQARFINRRKDGSRYYVEQSIAPVQDEHGRCTHYISTSWQVDDIVEREKVLYAMASEDKLTGLLNRRAGDEALATAYRRWRDEHCPLSIIICDIDHFKHVNDTYGHLAGDRVIQHIAKALKEQVRPGDPVIRWGGEEFMVVIHAPQVTAVNLAERLRNAVSVLEDDEVGRVTLSLGVAEVMPGESVEQLLGRADGALYRAKSNGRNMTMHASGQ
ncbi:diguanylate cyclase [Halomonas vilamensis]|uniref:Diguanylate cyclase n=1 Tax=Vreelandella vilamensis TaxID=531309 RepID=A0ABU1H5J2_9GAMM|nr:diguanylate cyclase [Halomonas vilamensis]MDR5899572.1 diguanylate cyclase [Halomonas vilamensis]